MKSFATRITQLASTAIVFVTAVGCVQVGGHSAQGVHGTQAQQQQRTRMVTGQTTHAAGTSSAVEQVRNY